MISKDLCGNCHKEQKRVKTRWERFKEWCVGFFPKETYELASEKYTEGFGQGYKTGFENAKELGAFTQRIVGSLDELTLALTQGLKLPTTFDEKSLIEFRSDGKGGASILIGGQEIKGEALAGLKIEAEKLREMRLWNLMRDKLKELAIRQAINQSTSWEEVLAGKMALHNVALIESMLESLRNAKTS